jgi:hypothetical protein
MEQNSQGPLNYQTPPRQRPWHQKVWRFVDQVNRDFVHTKVAAVLSFLMFIVFLLLINPWTRRLIFLWLFRGE